MTDEPVTPGRSALAGSHGRRLLLWRHRVAVLAMAAILGSAGCASSGETSTASSPYGVAAPSGAPAAIAADSAGSSVTGRESLAGAVLRRLAVAVADRDRTAFLAGWADDPSARRRAWLAYRNLVALGVTEFDPVPVPGTTRRAASSWSASVTVTWKVAGTDPASSHTPLRAVFTEHDGAARVSSLAPPAHTRLPVWLLPGLTVRRGVRTVVAATDASSAERIGRLLDGAVGAVGDVLAGWHGTLVAYAPGTVREFAALLGADARGYARIAAVTTTADGSRERSTPLAIVIDPAVFGGLRPVEARVVVVHEATHAATDAATVPMPLWVAEGFADYVGIGSVHLPPSVAAAGALRVVRRHGAPAALPGDAAFAAGGGALDVAYEESWLATRLIAQRYGRARLVAFYRAVEAHPQRADAAFRAVLHTTRSAFTTSWRRSLGALARGG